MNRTRLLMIGTLALALGLFASVYVYKHLASGGGSNDAGVEVMVAKHDLAVGSRVEQSDIGTIRVAAKDLPPNAPRKYADVVGHGVIIPIAQGEFILPNRLAGENAGSGMPSLIPPGMRAVSVRVNEVVSVAGFVTPGTRVDVLLTGTPGSSGEQQTTTILQNVAVLASGKSLERDTNGGAQTTAVITLLVSPDDAERLALASSEGHIQLALRNPVDTKQEDVTATNAHSLYKGGLPTPSTGEEAPVVHHVVARKPTPPPVVTKPTGVSIEVYQGDKKTDVVKFDEPPEAK